MGILHVATKDEKTKELVIDLLHALQGVEVMEEKLSIGNTRDSFRQLCGIWKDRDISLADIRTKAWQRDSE